jgi:hypothetical protein
MRQEAGDKVEWFTGLIETQWIVTLPTENFDDLRKSAVGSESPNRIHEFSGLTESSFRIPQKILTHQKKSSSLH